ncbi:MAG: Ankyrin-2 [Icmadophila ericetorum]|nr:Ankyrin-2 [Icmadophila ericetorum]
MSGPTWAPDLYFDLPGPTRFPDAFANTSFSFIEASTIEHLASQETPLPTNLCLKIQQPSNRGQKRQFPLEQPHRKLGKPSFIWTNGTRRELLELYLKTAIPMKDIHTSLARSGFAPCRSVCHKELKRLLKTDRPNALRLKRDSPTAQSRQNKLIEALIEQQEKDNTLQETADRSRGPSVVPSAKTSEPTRLDHVKIDLGFPLDTGSRFPSSPFDGWRWLHTSHWPATASEKPLSSGPSDLTIGQAEEQEVSSPLIKLGPANEMQSLRLPHQLQETNATSWQSANVRTDLDPIREVSTEVEENIYSIVRNWATLKERDSKLQIAGTHSSRTKDLQHRISKTSLGFDFMFRSGDRLIHVAVRLQDRSLLKALLDFGADLDGKTLQGKSALHIAAEIGNLLVCGLLLKRKIQVNASTSDGYTALHLAVRASKVLICAELLKYRASVSSKTKSGITALHIAVETGDEWSCNALIGRGARINEVTNEGLTALHKAIATGNPEICSLLLVNGANARMQAHGVESFDEYAKRQYERVRHFDTHLSLRVLECSSIINIHVAQQSVGNVVLNYRVIDSL